MSQHSPASPRIWPITLALGTALSLPAQQDDALATRVAALTARGPATPLTLLPIKLLGRPDANAADALGLVLERQGMPDLEVAAAPFTTAADTAWDQVPALLAAHVRALDASTPARTWLYAEFLGTPKRGPEEVRFVLVDHTGALLLADRQLPTDPDFKRTAGRDPDPLGCATLVADRLFKTAGWKKAPGSIKAGKFAELWRAKSGLADQRELAAMRQRRDTLRENLGKARFAVLPTVSVATHDAASAARLAECVAKALGCHAATAADATKLQVAVSSNEQKRLWDLARGLREHVRQHPLDADYVLVADLGVHEHDGPRWVHVAVCDKAGEFVIVDMLNDQSPQFIKAQPKTLQDAEQLAADHLRQLLH